MKKRLIACLPAIFIFLTSCNYLSGKIEKNFCDKITTINDSLDKLESDWLYTLNSAMLKKEYSGLNNKRIFIGQFISRNRILVAETETTTRMENFRADERTYLMNQAQALSDNFTAFEQYSEFTPAATVEQNLKLVVGVINNGKLTSAKINSELADFAIKHGLNKSK